MSKVKTFLLFLGCTAAGLAAGWYARQVADTYDAATREAGHEQAR